MSSAVSEDWIARPGGAIGGRLQVPGDKSISHRAVMFSALADGVCEISNFLTGADCRATAAAMQAMGVRIDTLSERHLRVHGVGMRGLKPPTTTLDLGNSGTSMRLFCGLLAGQGFELTLTGDESLSKRPMRRVTDPLSQMGARFSTTEAGTAPLTIHAAAELSALDYVMPMASAQVKSAVLLAGLYADGCTAVTEPKVTRDHTERMLRGFGYAVDREGSRVSLSGGGQLRASNIEVPGDLSSAAFFFVAAAIQPGATIRIDNVGINPTRVGVLEVLRRMGAQVEISAQRESMGEPVATVSVTGAPLKGIEIDEDLVALAIDELPVLFVAAACAEGETVVSGAEELRVKESDRVATMADGLQAVGIEAEARPDGIRIVGGQIRGGEINSHGDHRIAMSFAVAAQRSIEPIVLRDCANVATSFPGFLECATQAGLRVEPLA
ncbi:3-phosphoshikimate 1-carboxyvinyltransferase [Oceanococcus atlanticus]|uniref:3-phosphoshikimate 1-carboxyvinyltransferase n=1 Tax=Oceanococcus atlanticus TaxID=1317117 RepID=A0A1Y1SF90_9GAMM|nr:3-phosphoshikimate 1-carboxyvinyltransferase [Oceanococcus atlanticus]ORE88278.1 3-phosphoshikimate 1-carboxyvinyltransferase [Oceanococcus atlanticus]